MATVGTSVRRKEGPEKLSGRALYIDDIPLKGCLHGVTLRSTIPRGRIRRIVYEAGFPWEQCVIVTAKDIPGENLVALIETDQPLLAQGDVRHPMEPILLLAHPERERAYEALRHIRVEYEPQTPVLTIADSLAKRQVIYGDNNVFKEFLITKGEIEKGFALADYVVEGEYKVPHQEQAYIENNGMAAHIEADGTVVAMGSMQCPYYIHKALMKIFAKPEAKIRVIQTTTGGGFGGKEEYPSMLAGHAALLALKAATSKMIHDRAR
jgi:CO/xanthine dehydrogenase Mo-binding subunit